MDTNVPGEYEITYIATDQSNNSSEKKIKIKVEANSNAVANNNDNNNKANENKNNTQKVLNTQQNNHSNAKSEQKVAEQPKQQPQPQSVPKSQPTQPAQPAPVAPKQTSQPTPVKPKQTQESTPAPQPKPKENKVIYANLSNFEQIVLKSTKPVIVDFYTETCGICKYISPIIDEMAKERTDFKIVKIDANKNFALAKRYNFRLVPTLIVFRDGKEVKRITQPGTKSEILSLTR